MHSTQNHACVFVTAPNVTVARKLAAAALTDRLAACANLIPKIESHYWWQGKLESSAEVLILFKTAKSRLAELEKCVVRHHPYDTPEFIVLNLNEGNEKYLKWITSSVQAAD
jgi:periplasmic divalent cation tolerance protein